MDSSYLWAALLCVYTGVWRYLTGMYSGQPTFFTRKRIAIMKKTNATKLFIALLVSAALIVVIYYIVYLYNA